MFTHSGGELFVRNLLTTKSNKRLHNMKLENAKSTWQCSSQKMEKKSSYTFRNPPLVQYSLVIGKPL